MRGVSGVYAESQGVVRSGEHTCDVVVEDLVREYGYLHECSGARVLGAELVVMVDVLAAPLEHAVVHGAAILAE